MAIKRRELSRSGETVNPVPRLPHPSWQWATAQRAVAGGNVDHRSLSADDFWNRLGV